MRGRTLAGVLILALGAAGCDDGDPAGLDPVATESPAAVADRGGSAGVAATGSLLTDIPVRFGDVEEARLTVTEITRDETGQLLVDGLLRWEQDGMEVTEVFADVPAELSRTAPAGGGSLMQMQRAPNEPGVCDILYLDLGPLFLDLLGLTVDLAPIELDVDANRGPGNLLGNLLCAVTGLLDGGPLAAINNLLDRINSILDGLFGLASNIPVTGTLPDGVLEGTLTLTELGLDEAGNIVGSGTLSGTVNQGGTLTNVTQAFEDVVLSLSETAPAPSGMMLAAAPGDRAPNEPGVCDILFLDLGPIFLDLLGLTVDLAPVVLDVDAQRGPGNLLGNLLCAVLGLLDGSPLDLDALSGLLDRITGLLGG